MASPVRRSMFQGFAYDGAMCPTARSSSICLNGRACGEVRRIIHMARLPQCCNIDTPLWQAISSVADDIGASGIAGSIRSEEQIYTLQLVRFALSTTKASVQ